MYHPLYFFSIDTPLLIFYLFCTKYDFFARSKTLYKKNSQKMLFYELRNNSAANLFPSFFNVKSPSYFFILLWTFSNPIPPFFPYLYTGKPFLHFTSLQLFSMLTTIILWYEPILMQIYFSPFSFSVASIALSNKFPKIVVMSIGSMKFKFTLSTFIVTEIPFLS